MLTLYLCASSRGGIVSGLTNLVTERFGIPIWARVRKFSFITVHTGTWGEQLPSYSVGTGLHSLGKSGRVMKLNTQFHLVPRLRMSGAITPHPLHPFITRTGTFCYVHAIGFAGIFTVHFVKENSAPWRYVVT